ncbi:hypothetical protein BH10BAC2_BH10BAC2_06860 [soil metagenome]
MKALFIAISVLTATSCFAQTQPPAPVQEAFKKDFPGITVKKWEKENGNYEASFSKVGKTMSAVFDAKGVWVETETDIEISALPAAVVAYVKANYSSAGIKEAAHIKTPTGEMYEAEVKGKDLLFDMQGKFIKEVREEGGKEDEDD